jgi:nuclear pore complex protein Nup205
MRSQKKTQSNNIKFQAVIQFAWSMSLATIRSSTIQLASAQNILEDDEAVLDAALENGLFHCLPHCLITKKTLTSEEFYYRRIHQLITDLIVLMPLKVNFRFR